MKSALLDKEIQVKGEKADFLSHLIIGSESRFSLTLFRDIINITFSVALCEGESWLFVFDENIFVGIMLNGLKIFIKTHQN